jgi:hypothetical protein
MNDVEANRILDDIESAAVSTNPDKIRKTFSALVFLDGARIAKLAEQVMAETDLGDLLGEFAGDEAFHRLTMDVFYGSMLESLREKAPEADESVEHDVPSWIDGNAPLVAAANLGIMEEAALPANGVPDRRALIQFHRIIDLAACEEEQTTALLSVWSPN